MAITVGDLKTLLEFIDDDVPVIRTDSEYGYGMVETAEFRFINRTGDYVSLADDDAPITTPIGLVIW